MASQNQLYENVCLLITDTQAQFSALELGQKLQWFRIHGSSKFFKKNLKYGSISWTPRIENLGFNSVLNFRRVTHFWLCLLETQQCVVLYPHSPGSSVVPMVIIVLWSPQSMQSLQSLQFCGPIVLVVLWSLQSSQSCGPLSPCSPYSHCISLVPIVPTVPIIPCSPVVPYSLSSAKNRVYH